MAKDRPPRLGDLFVSRTPDDNPVVFTSPVGEVKVHVVLLNEPDNDAVERRAKAAQARRLAVLGDRDSDDYMAIHATALESSDPDDLIGALVAQEMQEPAIAINAQIRDRDEWAKDDRLIGLEEAWYGDDNEPGLRFHLPDQDADPDVEQDPDVEPDPLADEAQAVWEQLRIFHSQVDAAVTDKADDLRESYENPDDIDDPAEAEEAMTRLRHKYTEMLVKLDATLRYYVEFDRQRIFYATRQFPDWRARYFETVSEADAVDEQVKAKLRAVYKGLSLDDTSVKGSPETPGSSPSSVSSDEGGLSRPSGLEDANA